MFRVFSVVPVFFFQRFLLSAAVKDEKVIKRQMAIKISLLQRLEVVLKEGAYFL